MWLQILGDDVVTNEGRPWMTRKHRDIYHYAGMRNLIWEEDPKVPKRGNCTKRLRGDRKKKKPLTSNRSKSLKMGDDNDQEGQVKHFDRVCVKWLTMWLCQLPSFQLCLLHGHHCILSVVIPLRIQVMHQRKQAFLCCLCDGRAQNMGSHSLM